EAKRSGLVETGLRNSGQPAIFLPASPPSSASMAIQASEGVSLHVKIEGPEEAPMCFVLLHSLGMDHTFWSRVAPVLSETARVVTLDLRGHGKSSKPKGPYKVGDMAADVRAVLDSINCTEVIVAGASMGGCVALQFTIDHPQLVRGLALIDTTAWYGPSAAKDWAQRAANAQQDGFEAMVEFQQSRWFTEEFRRSHASEVRACTEVFLSNDMDGYVASCLALGTFDAREHLANIHTPTAVVV